MYTCEKAMSVENRLYVLEISKKYTFLNMGIGGFRRPAPSLKIGKNR
jgi:hypothetical protein